MAKRTKKNIPFLLLVITVALFGFFMMKNKIADTQIPSSQEKNNPSDENKIELIFTGDIMLDRGVEWKIINEGEDDFTFPFKKISEELNGADIVFGNLESPISDKGEKAGSIYSFRADPKAMEGLTFAGFNVLSLANNHAFDYTSKALSDTFSRLKQADIDYVGGGQNATEAATPVIKEVKVTKFAFLAYTNLCPLSWNATAEKAGVNCVSLDDLQKIKNEIAAAKKQADIVIVSMHAGEEYTQEINEFQTKFSRAAIDAGADIVIGHHPHVAQKYEEYKGKWIFYSLGNFVFDQSFSEETMQGLMLKVAVRDKKITEIIPVRTQLNDFFQVEATKTETVIFPQAQEEQASTVVLTNVESATTSSPEFHISSLNPKQGDTVLVWMKNTEISGVTGTFNSKKLKFFETNGMVFSLIGIDAKMRPGNYKMAIVLADGSKTEKTLAIKSANFPVTVLYFTQELEKEGYSATSVAETLAANDNAKINQAMSTSSGVAYFKQSFTNPLVKMVNVGAFGNIRQSNGVSLQHLGTDLKANLNTPVYAINDGKVAGVLELVNYGNTVIIDHGLGIFSLYLHLNKINVAEGQMIKKDQVIGLSGNTGYSISPHLHLSVNLNGASVDPEKFIKMADFSE
jgi:poly-gamma-glutamate capsule biosynthesis protein CapA/YwtB (metallophosphatase superfamily)